MSLSVSLSQAHRSNGKGWWYICMMLDATQKLTFVSSTYVGVKGPRPCQLNISGKFIIFSALWNELKTKYFYPGKLFPTEQTFVFNFHLQFTKSFFIKSTQKSPKINKFSIKILSFLQLHQTLLVQMARCVYKISSSCKF